MMAEIGMRPFKIDPMDLAVDIVPQTKISIRFGTMTIRNTQVANYISGFVVSVGHPIEGRDFTTKFRQENSGSTSFKCAPPNTDKRDLFWAHLQNDADYECAKHIDDWCKIARGGFEKIVIDVREWCPRDKYHHTHAVASCQSLVINSNEERTIAMWLKRIVCGLESITIKPAVDIVSKNNAGPVVLSEEIARMQVWSSPSLKELVLMHYVPFTDDQFLSLRAPSFDIMTSTISDTAINQYFHKWANGELPKSQRFGISLHRQVEVVKILKDLLFVPWDANFRETMTELVAATPQDYRNCWFTVFRTVRNAEECSNATLVFTYDQSIYLEVTDLNFKFEAALNETQRERANLYSL